MSGIPDEITLHVVPLNITGGLGLGINGTMVVDAGLDDVQLKATGDPARPIAIDIGLDDIKLKIDPLNIKLEPVRLTIDPLKIDLGLDNVKVDLGLDNVNVCMSLALTQLPRMQLHVPTNYNFGFSLLGVPIVNFGICGETSVVTDDNPPRIFTKTQSGSHKRPTPPTPGTSSPPGKPEQAYRVSAG